ncbi:hypothetical protein [Rothia nasisuis]|uniref:hypothetical protein n=1 Tax=Rothia nasisuis TaxID=2109647 RepID=UPI001F3CF749|nr:hypothetical protein [Rothia nasisuis]
MTVHELTLEDLAQLLTPPPPAPGKSTLHYYNRLWVTGPALCGTMPDGGSWEHHYRPGRTAYTAGGKLAPQFELCPICQVRYSYPVPPAASGGAQ